jgi:hypothetical protein
MGVQRVDGSGGGVMETRNKCMRGRERGDARQRVRRRDCATCNRQRNRRGCDGFQWLQLDRISAVTIPPTTGQDASKAKGASSQQVTESRVFTGSLFLAQLTRT